MSRLMEHFLSRTTNLNAFYLTPAVRICRVRALTERKYQVPFELLTSGTSTFWLLRFPNVSLQFDHVYMIGEVTIGEII